MLKVDIVLGHILKIVSEGENSRESASHFLNKSYSSSPRLSLCDNLKILSFGEHRVEVPEPLHFDQYCWPLTSAFMVVSPSRTFGPRIAVYRPNNVLDFQLMTTVHALGRDAPDVHRLTLRGLANT